LKLRRTILIVDDDEAIWEFVEWALIDEDYNVLGAADGASALEIIARESPDLILLDLRMPGIDGVAFANAYASLPEPRAPLIVVTAASGRLDPTPVVGMAERIDKPFDLDDLFAVIERHTVLR
jgi:CheY-like chemotaxis protein